MQAIPHITINDIAHTAALETHIKEKINKLNQFCDDILRCDVVIDKAQNQKHTGKLYNVRITLNVPGEEMNVNRHTDENAYIAIRNSFKSMQRKLQEFMHKRRGEVKVHEIQHAGTISRLYPEEDYGFIAANGSEYYFHRSNLSNVEYEDLHKDLSVHFIATMGTEGPHAMRVSVSKQHEHNDK